MSTPETDLMDIEERLRAALTARADLVRPEDLAPVAPVLPLRPRWQSPWVLLATAAVVLLVLGVVLQGIGGRQRSDDIAPKPDQQVELELPDDVGADWTPEDLASPSRLDLDGDGTKEKVVFLAEPTKEHDGRLRLQTTLSSTGEEAYGLAQLQSTLGVITFDPIDADGDGDQELVLPWEDLGAGGPSAPGHPLVYDLRDGLLVQVAVDRPELLQMGHVPVPGSATQYYDMVHHQAYWVEDGQLLSSRTVRPFAHGNMTVLSPEDTVVDTWRWVLDESGLLRPEEAGCLVETRESERRPCPDGAADSLPVLGPASTDGIGVGGSASFVDGYPRFDASIRDSQEPVLDVQVRADLGTEGVRLSFPLDLPDPVVDLQQPTGVFYDGVSLLVRSASDPARMAVLVQRDDRLVALEPVGDVPFGTGTTASGRAYRSWVTTQRDQVSSDGQVTSGGAVITVVEADDGAWQAWSWQMVSRTEMAPLPWGTVCFDDVVDPSSIRRC